MAQGTEGCIRRAGGEILVDAKFTLPLEFDPAGLVDALIHAGVRVRSFAKIRRTLEDVYMEILDGAGSPN